MSATSSSSSRPTTPPSPPSPPLDDAERRLREAEDRLHDAIEELQRRQRTAACCGPQQCPPCHHAADESCVANAIGNLCQSFLLSYGVRVGIGILLRAFKLVRRQSYSSLLDLKVRLPLLRFVLLASPFLNVGGLGGRLGGRRSLIE